MINKFLELLGVEVGEKFNIRFVENGLLSNYNPYHFEISDGNFHLLDCEGDLCNSYVRVIVSGRYKIEKLPWKPKDSDKYWFVNPKGHLVHAYFCEDGMVDLYNFNTGNCFKTEEDAEAHKDEVLKRFNEIKEELNA